MLAKTDTEYAPWTVIESHDYHFAALKMFATISSALKKRTTSSPGPRALKKDLRPSAFGVRTRKNWTRQYLTK